MNLLDALLDGLRTTSAETFPRTSSPSSPSSLQKAGGREEGDESDDVREKLPASVGGPELARRVVAFRAQLAAWIADGRGAVPVLAFLPGVEAGPGRCCSCGEALDAGRSWRCSPCEAAVREVLGLPTAGSEA